jgi:hypothetical protein
VAIYSGGGGALNILILLSALLLIYFYYLNKHGDLSISYTIKRGYYFCYFSDFNKQ